MTKYRQEMEEAATKQKQEAAERIKSNKPPSPK